MIYKILSSKEWTEALAAGEFRGSAVDLRDGFIHFSAPAQVRETAARHFAKEQGLLLLGVDEVPLGPALRWEASRGGALFPHLYAPLPVEAVVSIIELPWQRGRHLFPDTL